MQVPASSVRSAFRRALLPILVAALALAALAAGPATAATMRLPSGKAVTYTPLRSAQPPEVSPFDLAFSNLDYNGGPVMPSNTNYTIYWSPGGLSDFPAGVNWTYADGIDQYFVDLAHDSTLSQASGGAGRQNVESVATQYNDSDGNVAAYDSHFGGRIVDTNAFPVSGCTGATICLTKAQMETEIARVISANSLSAGLTHQYFLITPLGVESCFDAAGAVCSAGSSLHPFYCAFHGNIGIQNPIIYSIDNYASGNVGCDDGISPNGNPSDGLIQAGLSHEHNESITDPLPNTAWTDFGSPVSIGENGDKCAGDKAGQLINGNTYWYQKEWSNFTGQCLARLPLTPQPVTASFTTTRTSSTTASFTAATDAGAGAKYVWQFNAPQDYTVETDSPTITHVFPDPGTFTVALTVMRSDGMSRGAASEVTLGTDPTAAFAAPADLIVGDDATFDASSSTTPNDAITDYRWGWGDGSADGAGVSASHRFSAPGTYAVSLTVTDGIGLTSTATHQIVVASRPDAPAAVPTASSGALTLGSMHSSYTRRSVIIASQLALPGPGTVVARGTTRSGTRRATRCNAVSHIDSAGAYTFRCSLGPASRAGLRHRRLSLRMAITFIPDGGPSTVWSRIITLGRHT